MFRKGSTQEGARERIVCQSANLVGSEGGKVTKGQERCQGRVVWSPGSLAEELSS